MQRRSRRTGFTLIELLVVIAIIAILASILFPVFSRAREKARQTACQSNLRQLGLGVNMYVQDYDETYPAFGYFAGAVPFTAFDGVLPYLKNRQILLCPDDKVGRVLGGPMSFIPSPPAPACSYAANLADPMSGALDTIPPIYVVGLPDPVLAGLMGLPYAAPVISEGDVGYPADTTLLFDGQANAAPPPILLPTLCHNGIANVAFCDGHVKAIKDFKRIGAGNDYGLGVP